MYKVAMNPSQYRIVRTILLLLCLCMTMLVSAQEEDPDTLMMEPPPPQEETVSAGVDDVGTSYDALTFLVAKWLQETGMDSLQLRRLPDSVLRRLRNDPDFWYADSVFKKDTVARDNRQSSTSKPDSSSVTPKKKRTSSTPIVRKADRGMRMDTLLWIIIIGGGLLLIFFLLASRNVNLFSKKKKTIEGAIDAEEENTDIFAIKYISEIDRAAMAGNYRLAIRLMFLRLLKAMAETNIIQYKHDRTNYDYLMQVSSTKHYNEFFRLTRNYEYAWYGKFPVSPEAYDIIKNDFDSFEAKVK